MVISQITPDLVADREGLRKLLGIRDSAISREIRVGRLRAYKLCNRDFFRGTDIIAWLESRTRRPGDDYDESDDTE